MVLFAADLVAAVAAVVVVVASPPAGNAFVVGALELGFRAVSVFSGTGFFVFVCIVSAIVFKIAQPSFWNTSSISASEISFFLARRTVCVELVRSVPAVVFAVAE